ncbi:unnamed protein product [Schistocephalus solidus]|uniref:Reverse transcriptase domain-containing protein n=1 Tax=Schistocephalus solidus TaxID=70667 RepID=A0A183TQQ0_SCHSO|nr:unnamed protein product [Schistocephalus solidus]
MHLNAVANHFFSVRDKDWQGLDARAHSGAILALLDDEVYDLTLSADISAATAPSAVLDGLRKILGSSEHPWVLQADFHRRYPQPGESINDLQQTLRLLGRRAFPTLDAKARSTGCLRNWSPVSVILRFGRSSCKIGCRPSRKLLPWLEKRKSSRPPVNNHRGRCSVSQLSSPTLPLTPPLSLLGSLALMALLPGGPQSKMLPFLWILTIIRIEFWILRC